MTKETQSLIDCAIKGLLIQQVSTRTISQVLKGEFEPGLTPTSIFPAFRYRPGGYKESAGLGSDGNRVQIVRFFYEFGLVLMDVNKPKDSQINGLTHEPVAEIDVVFSADYLKRDEKLTKEALEAFLQHNVCFHIWPYWREFVQSHLARSMLPNIAVPYFMKPASQNN